MYVGWHVAGDALGAFRAFLVEVVRGRVEIPRCPGKARIRIGLVALQADRVALELELAAVSIVAVVQVTPAGTCGSGGRSRPHRPPRAAGRRRDRVAVRQERGQVVVEDGLAGLGQGREFTPPLMTRRAELGFASRGSAVRGQVGRGASGGVGAASAPPAALLPFHVSSPGPWQDWHETLISAQRDAKVSVAGSYRFS